jgi:hypothetical protein
MALPPLDGEATLRVRHRLRRGCFQRSRRARWRSRSATLSDDPDAIRDALRGSSDGLLIAIREVDARERLKRGVRPDDPGFAPLARGVRVAAEAVLLLAREEETRAEEASRRTGGAAMPTIEASTPPPDLAGILAEWRAVERRLEAAEPASAEAQQLMEEFEILRDRYAQALMAYKRKR